MALQFDHNGKGSSAVFDESRRYRYALRRDWSNKEEPQYAVFIMLNPSKADAFLDDATIRRCVGFAKLWGLDGIWVANLFAYRTTYPKDLFKVKDPFGPDNSLALDLAFEAARDHKGTLVFAWGATDDDYVREWATKLTNLAKSFGVQPMCLGKTKSGMPCHPLRLRKDTSLEAYF